MEKVWRSESLNTPTPERGASGPGDAFPSETQHLNVSETTRNVSLSRENLEEPRQDLSGAGAGLSSERPSHLRPLR